MARIRNCLLAAAGVLVAATIAAGVTLQPGQYYLLRQASGAGGTDGRSGGSRFANHAPRPITAAAAAAAPTRHTVVRRPRLARPRQP